MATSVGLGQFGKRMRVVADIVQKNVGQVVRGAALTVDQVAVMTTPVDTGRARANWVVNLGAPVFSDVPFNAGGDAAAGQALTQGTGIIAAWKPGLGPIFIGNGVPYIGSLNAGSSRQAPNGMTDAALVAGAAFVRDRSILLKGT